MIFTDTGALYALAVATDANHSRAVAWYGSATDRLVTTEHVLAELLTLLRSRGQRRAAIDLGKRLFAGELVSIEWTTRADIEAAWAVFRDYDDKDWSFIDCVSMVVMRRLGIEAAFAFDRHFRQFPGVRALPEA